MGIVKTKYIKTVKVEDIDTGEHLFNLEVWKSSENNVRAYVGVTLKGVEFSTRFFMEHKTIAEVRYAFKKEIREKVIKLDYPSIVKVNYYE